MADKSTGIRAGSVRTFSHKKVQWQKRFAASPISQSIEIYLFWPGNRV